MAATGEIDQNTPECAAGCSWGYLDGSNCSETCASGLYELVNGARVCRKVEEG